MPTKFVERRASVADVETANAAGIGVDSDTNELQYKSGASKRTVADLALTQTLTNKTLTNPVINQAGGTLVLPTAAVPAQTAEGSVVWDSNDDLLTVGDGASRKTMVDLAGTQTLTNKTLTAPTITGGTSTAKRVVTAYAADGAIAIAAGVAKLTKAGVNAMTLANPAAGDEGTVLLIQAQTANAHTVTVTGGFAGAGAGADVATFGGAIGDGLQLVAVNLLWHVVSLRNVTLG